MAFRVSRPDLGAQRMPASAPKPNPATNQTFLLLRWSGILPPDFPYLALRFQQSFEVASPLMSCGHGDLASLSSGQTTAAFLAVAATAMARVLEQEPCQVAKVLRGKAKWVEAFVAE